MDEKQIKVYLERITIKEKNKVLVGDRFKCLCTGNIFTAEYEDSFAWAVVEDDINLHFLEEKILYEKIKNQKLKEQ